MMGRAIQLAARGRPWTSPNPMVGCLLVDRGRVVAEGFHARFGGHHAERRLLHRLGGEAISRSATLYLTLEPCSYHGKTPPCVDALLESRIGRFVIATTDPNPRVQGRGVAALRKDGRDVRLGLLGARVREENQPFFLRHQLGRSRVTVKLASSLDGKLADAWGKARWITEPESRREVASMRAQVDAIVVGAGTVRLDDPRLDSSTHPVRSPSRIVVTNRLDLDPDCRLARRWRAQVGSIRTAEGEQLGNWLRESQRPRRRWIWRPRLIAATTEMGSRRVNRFRRRGWEVWKLPEQDGHVDLAALVRLTAAEGLVDLLVEPGPTLASSLLEKGPIDRLSLFVSSKVLGGAGGWSRDLLARKIDSPLELGEPRTVRSVGTDLLLEFWPGGRRAIR